MRCRSRHCCHLVRLLLPVLAAVVLLAAPPARAARLAVLPVADLSRGANAVNQLFQAAIAQVLAGQEPIELVPEDQVIEFLAANRIRVTGYLTSSDILLAGSQLRADFLLIASLCELRDTPPAVAVTATIYRTSDGSTVWAKTMGASDRSRQHLLGLDQVSRGTDLIPGLLADFFAGLPAALGPMAAVPGRWRPLGAPPPAITVTSARIHPQEVRPGGRVHCSVELQHLEEGGQAPKVYIKAGSALYQAQALPQSRGFEVSWTAPAKMTNQPTRVAMAATDNPTLYRNLLDADSGNDRYPVSLEIVWPGGERQSVYLGAYRVDATPPAFQLRPQGKRLDQVPAFRRQLPIAVVWQRPEPLRHWEFTVSDLGGKILLRQEGTERLPAVFTWSGRLSEGPAPAGLYTVAVSATDRAGNTSRAAFTVRYHPQPPAVAVERCGDGCLQLAGDTVVPVDYWRLERWEDDRFLGAEEGVELPAAVHLETIPTGPLLLVVRDRLGNESRRDIGDLARIALRPTTAEPAPKARSTWVDDF